MFFKMYNCNKAYDCLFYSSSTWLQHKLKTATTKYEHLGYLISWWSIFFLHLELILPNTCALLIKKGSIVFSLLIGYGEGRIDWICSKVYQIVIDRQVDQTSNLHIILSEQFKNERCFYVIRYFIEKTD